MAKDSKNQLYREGQALEKSGQLKSAYENYLSAHAYQDAARLLASAGKPEEAGRLILHQLKIEPDKVDRLLGNDRKLAYLAATYLAKSQHTSSLALQIFITLGERTRAAELLERQGEFTLADRVRSGKPLEDTGSPKPFIRRGDIARSNHVTRTDQDKTAARRLEQEGKHDAAVAAFIENRHYDEAARVLRSLGRYGEAANLFSQSGMFYEAGVCYLEVGETDKGLDSLTRIQRTHPRYRMAAAEAIQVANKLNVLSFQLEHFLTEFVARGPVDSAEVNAYYELGELYKRQGLLENAKEVWQKILDQNPLEERAKALLDALAKQAEVSSHIYTNIRNQDASYIGKQGLAGPAPRPRAPAVLPDLPDLPDLPPPPRITGLDINPEGIPVSNAHTKSPFDSKSLGQADTISIPDASRIHHAEPNEGALDSQRATLDSGIASGSAGVTQAIGSTSRGLETEFAAGNVIANRYRLIAELGRGGMAMVYEAYDLELDEDIALKVFLRQETDPNIQKESLARFRQELKLSRQLVHPNIIRLYDIGLHLGHRYISMELLRGTVLEDLLGARLNFAQGLAYLIQVCGGLHAAHDKGVVHRDIKPDNLFVTTDDVVKVMDFGIAKNTHVRGLTMEGMTAGTPEYIAPEQINDFSNVTGRADQYALGLIAYRMFTGTLPFEHEELTPLLLMHLHHKPEPPKERNPQIPDVLNNIILKLLEKKPEDRFASCLELATYLKKILVHYKRT